MRIVFVLLFLAGCSTAEPYAELGVRYAFPFSSDYWVHQDRSWTCDEPYQFEGEVGAEWPNGWHAYVYHESFWLCGTFNEKPEIFENGIGVKKKWGGH